MNSVFRNFLIASISACFAARMSKSIQGFSSITFGCCRSVKTLIRTPLVRIPTRTDGVALK
ncbi:MAG: hypothetical protein QM820_34765 [Minicystis sp.]